MKTKQTRQKLPIAALVALVASFALGLAAEAADNYYGKRKLDSGYQLTQT